MEEKNLDFDTVIPRKNTNSIKYDSAVQRGMPETILPLWVADMDFRISSYIQAAIEKQLNHGIFGYSDVGVSYYDSVKDWMLKQHGWKTKPEWLVKTPGVVFAIAMAIQAFTKENDGVLIQTPVYYPFAQMIKKNKRRLVDNPLVIKKDGKYHMDMNEFENKIISEKVKLFILCSPHNPVGRVWTKEELERVGEICIRNQVLVISDEIHADFAFSKQHQVFADVKEALKDITITCTSPSKTFNLAGLQVSNIFIANPNLRKRYENQIETTGYSQLNAVGLTACEVAYRSGQEWYEAVCAYIKDNIAFTKSFIEEHLPQLKVIETEGTYLVWVDFRELGMTMEQREELIVKKAGLWLDSGVMFGAAGKGFERFNVACQRKTLVLALTRLANAIIGDAKFKE